MPQVEKTMIIITKISIITNDIGEMIGKPMDFLDFKKNNYENPEGNPNP
jgi:hypothetical protein